MNARLACIIKFVFVAVVVQVAALQVFAVSKPKQKTTISSLLVRDPALIDKQFVVSVCGKPGKLVEDERKLKLEYAGEKFKLLAEWDKEKGMLKKLSYDLLAAITVPAMDYRLADKLHDGVTGLREVVAIFGNNPKSFVIKENNVELYYVFKDTNLRLFFRDRILVDFTLYGTGKG